MQASSTFMSFAINITNPRRGWIDVEIRLGEQRFEFAASDVANDPVRQLAELALSLVRCEPPNARAVFWLEPSGYELSAIRDPELELMLSYSEDAFANLFDPSVVLQQPVDASATAGEILRCLGTAKSLVAAAGAVDERPWAHPFPDALVGQLEAALEASGISTKTPHRKVDTE
jgi:hypothetical protein